MLLFIWASSSVSPSSLYLLTLCFYNPFLGLIFRFILWDRLLMLKWFRVMDFWLPSLMETSLLVPIVVVVMFLWLRSFIIGVSLLFSLKPNSDFNFIRRVESFYYKFPCTTGLSFKLTGSYDVLWCVDKGRSSFAF